MAETTGVKVRETTGYLVFKWFNTIIMINNISALFKVH